MLGTYTATIVERPAITAADAEHAVIPATEADLSHLKDLLALDGDHRARLANGDICLVAHLNDDPVGLLWLNLVSHTDTYLGRCSRPSPETAYYNQLQVATEYRRQGIARSLVVAALHECIRRERKTLRAAVLHGNTASADLHEALEFAPVAIVRGVRVGSLTVRLPYTSHKGGR